MLFRKVADNQNEESISTSMRRKRFDFFLELLAGVPRPLTILDVGGTQGFWERMGFVDEKGVQVTVLNMAPQEVRYSNFTSVQGDATNLSEYATNQFDVVFSNSVIEHVGTRTQQRQMADEVMRVGRRYFVQTPNYYFPIEPHFLFPGFQWLPVDVRVWMLAHFDLGWVKRAPSVEAARAEVEEIELLRKDELLALFPGANLYRERAFGLVKSFIVYGGWN